MELGGAPTALVLKWDFQSDKSGPETLAGSYKKTGFYMWKMGT